MTGSPIARALIDVDSNERFQRLRRQLGVTSFGINAVVLQPRQRGRIHAHEHQEEVYLVLVGTLTVIVADEELSFGPYELACLQPEVRRQLVNRGDEAVVLLAIGGHGRHEGRDGLPFRDWDDKEPTPDLPWPEDLPSA